MNKTLLLFYVCACSIICGVECGRGGRGGGHSSHGGGHSSHGGGHSSHGGGHSRWSSGGGWFSSGGSRTHSTQGGSSGGHGSGGSPSYPPSPGLSGYGGSSGGHGSVGSPSYPHSPGLSGYGGSSRGQGSGGAPSYPHSPGLSGHGSGSSYQYNSKYHTHGGYGYVPYTYHTAPQTVYINQYRNTESRYGDLLTGLALYNLGRSHGHHYHHYYEDDYYRTRYSSASHQRPYDAPRETAKCYLRIEGEGRDQRLTVPCEIVSTFTDDSERTQVPVETKLVCKNVTVPAKMASRLENNNFKFLSHREISDVLNSNLTGEEKGKQIDLILQREYGIPLSDWSTRRPNWDRATGETVTTSSTTAQSSSANDVTPSPSDSPSPMMNITKDIRVCVNETSSVNETSADPLTQKGQKVEVTPKMKCTVEIETRESLLRRQVDCKALEVYSKMPEPKKESTLTPSRNTLKSWMNSPPWWMAMFIAV